MNYHDICRICINENSHMISVFESHNFSTLNNCEIFKVITDCASVQIQAFDGFSQQICLKCLDHLSQAYSFKKLCEESDYKFRNNLIIGDAIATESESNNKNSTITYGDVHNNVIVNTDENRTISDFDSSKVKEEISEEDIVIDYGEIHNESYENLDEKCNIIDFEYPDIKAEQSHDEITTEINNYIEQDGVEETGILSDSCNEFESTEYEAPSSLKKSESERDGTSDSSHKCNICSKECLSDLSLSIHMRVHPEQKQYKCDFCDKKFKLKIRLLKHIRDHKGGNPLNITLTKDNLKLSNCSVSLTKIEVGSKFSSYEEFSAAFDVYKASVNNDYWIRDARTIENQQKRLPETVININKSIKYYYIKLACVKGGRTFKSKNENSSRKCSTFKQNCEASIFVRASACKQYLCIKDIKENHNHTSTKSDFTFLTQQCLKHTKRKKQ